MAHRSAQALGEIIRQQRELAEMSMRRVAIGARIVRMNYQQIITIEPGNPVLKARIEDIARLRAGRAPTLPTNIAAELAANPFLRVEEPAIQAAVGMAGAAPAAVFGELRARKDRF